MKKTKKDEIVDIILNHIDSKFKDKIELISISINDGNALTCLEYIIDISNSNHFERLIDNLISRISNQELCNKIMLLYQIDERKKFLIRYLNKFIAWLDEVNKYTDDNTAINSNLIKERIREFIADQLIEFKLNYNFGTKRKEFREYFIELEKEHDI